MRTAHPGPSGKLVADYGCAALPARGRCVEDRGANKQLGDRVAHVPGGWAEGRRQRHQQRGRSATAIQPGEHKQVGCLS